MNEFEGLSCRLPRAPANPLPPDSQALEAVEIVNAQHPLARSAVRWGRRRRRPKAVVKLVKRVRHGRLGRCRHSSRGRRAERVEVLHLGGQARRRVGDRRRGARRRRVGGWVGSAVGAVGRMEMVGCKEMVGATVGGVGAGDGCVGSVVG